MKKIIATIAAFTMAFALCSCGRSADSEPVAAQPSAVTTAATAETAAETAAVTTAPQSEPTTTTTAKGETTTPENTTTADATTTSESTTTTAAEKQTTVAEKKTTTAKQTAAPKNTTTAKQTAAPKQTTTPKKTTAKPATTTKRVWTRELTEEEFWDLDWREQDDYMNWLSSQPPKVEFHTAEEVQKIREEYIQEHLRLINIERAKVGLQPVQLNSQLQEMANQRAYEEVVTTYQPHTRPDGSLCYTIYDDYNTELQYAGEICTGAGFLSVGAKTLAKINLDGWMYSDAHRPYILQPDVKYIGIGTYYFVNKVYDNISEKYYDDEFLSCIDLFAN